MNRIDELLNKYIDNELEPNELEEVQNLLKQEDVIAKLKGLQSVDNSLRKMEYESAPGKFAEKFMNNLRTAKPSIKLSKNYYATTINVLFILLIVGILGFIFGTMDWTSSNQSVSTKINETIAGVKKGIPALLSLFQNKSVMFFGSFISIILLIGAYYSIEAHKAFKKKIDSI